MALIIGDIHGCIDQFDALLEFAPLEDGDTIITLGDYIDRGRDSKGVIQRLIELQERFNMVTLKGNHDKFMLDARYYDNVYDFWMDERVGGAETLDSYGGSLDHVPDTHWQFLEECMLYYEMDDWICVHGGVHPDLPMVDQQAQILMNLRLNEALPHYSGKKVICGHTRQLSGMPHWKPGILCIDTNVFDGGYLSGFDSDSQLIYQVNAEGEHHQRHLDDIMAR
ncbi:metallophosphoesterase family protein [Rubritalea marina]|uniref:metallophosphoesterase family protein n=1 Tax=Rubritalea marina TaxID=361055 RepID=UPI0003798F1A|nr:metallophosphoesterase family protein [Rubritalea marina]